MALNIAEIQTEIQELIPEDRALLLDELEAEFIGILPEFKIAWSHEIRRRILEFRRMKPGLLEGEEVMREARTLLDAEL